MVQGLLGGGGLAGLPLLRLLSDVVIEDTVLPVSQRWISSSSSSSSSSSRGSGIVDKVNSRKPCILNSHSGAATWLAVVVVVVVVVVVALFLDAFTGFVSTYI